MLSLSGQHIAWEYNVVDNVGTFSSYFWTDEYGDGFYNIKKINPDRPGDMSYGAYLLILDSNGKLKGKTYIKDCSAQASFLPYGKNRLLTSGNRCLSNGYENSSTVFNYKGKVIRKGEGFEGHYFSRIWSNGKFYFFSKPLDHYSFSFVSIGTIDKRLKSSAHHLSLKQFEKEGMGITNHHKDPVQLKNETWIIPMALGEKTLPNANKIKPSHGLVMCTKDSTILWHYPKEITKQALEQVAAYENMIGVLFDRSHFVWLDEAGRQLKTLSLKTTNFYAKDMIINRDEIIILGNKNITWFDHNGKLKTVFDFKSNGIHQARRMREVEDGGIILTAKKDESVVILKIFSEKESIDTNNDQSSEDDGNVVNEGSRFENEIGNTTIETVAEEILSVSVFPNPATVAINFEIENETDLKGPYFIEIFDQKGKVIHTNRFSEKFYTIDLIDVFPGTYVYRISSVDSQKNTIVTGQFVKL